MAKNKSATTESAPVDVAPAPAQPEPQPEPDTNGQPKKRGGRPGKGEKTKADMAREAVADGMTEVTDIQAWVKAHYQGVEISYPTANNARKAAGVGPAKSGAVQVSQPTSRPASVAQTKAAILKLRTLLKEHDAETLVSIYQGMREVSEVFGPDGIEEMIEALA